MCIENETTKYKGNILAQRVRQKRVLHRFNEHYSPETYWTSMNFKLHLSFPAAFW